MHGERSMIRFRPRKPCHPEMIEGSRPAMRLIVLGIDSSPAVQNDEIFAYDNLRLFAPSRNGFPHHWSCLFQVERSGYNKAFLCSWTLMLTA